jgi:ankyrin repeat protein
MAFDNSRKQTALHWAVNSRKKPVVKVLMEYGADPFLQDAENKTAMEYAISSKQKELVEEMTRMLLQRDLDAVSVIGSAKNVC